MLFKETNGRQAAAQVQAFEDFWHWADAAPAYFEVVHQGPREVARLLAAFHDFLGQNDMMAYLAMMAIRLVELRRVLKSTGSIYLHCDPTASHYLKLVMDAVFGKENFKNEIIWNRSQPKAHASRRFSSSHDVLLFYGKSSDAVFYQQITEHDPAYVEKFYKFVEEGTGRRYGLWDLTNPNKNRPNLKYEFPPDTGMVRVWRWTRDRMMETWHAGRILVPRPGGVPRYKRYLDEMEGTSVTDIWTDIEHLHGSQHEFLGYPTQKPEALLERIISASSNEGDLVLDHFCGCGTTVAVAERLHRRWIGIDITHLAIGLMRHRLQSAFGPDLNKYEVIGEPQDLASARALFQEDAYQFQFWALSLVEARPAGDQQKKGADKGIDGWQFFFDDDSGSPKRIVISVKGGHVTPGQVRDLIGVVESNQAEMGVFLTLQPPTRPMLDAAAGAGTYQPPGLQEAVPQVQILTIEELLRGHGVQLPPRSNATFKRAPRRHKARPQGPGSALTLL